MAAENGKVESCRCLIFLNADVDSRDDYGYLPVGYMYDTGTQHDLDAILGGHRELDAAAVVNSSTLHAGARLPRETSIPMPKWVQPAAPSQAHAH